MDEFDSKFLKHVAAECPGFRARATARAITRLYNDAFRPLGITAEQFSLLVGIGLAEGTTVVDLAVSSGIDASTLSRNIRVLSRQGFVRAEGGQGRAGKRLSLTNLGLELMAIAITVWKRVTMEFSRSLGDERLQSVTLMLIELAEAAETSRV